MTCTCPACANMTKPPRSPLATLPGWDIAERIAVAEKLNAEAIRLAKEQSEWRDTYVEVG